MVTKKRTFHQTLTKMVICAIMMAIAGAFKAASISLTIGGITGQKLSFLFFVAIFAGLTQGPVWAMLVGIGGDLLGFFVFGNTGGAYFIGITLVAGICGLLAGLVRVATRGKRIQVWLIAMTAFTVNVVCNFLNTLCISYTTYIGATNTEAFRAVFISYLLPRTVFALMVGALYAVLMPVVVRNVRTG